MCGKGLDHTSYFYLAVEAAIYGSRDKLEREDIIKANPAPLQCVLSDVRLVVYSQSAN